MNVLHAVLDCLRHSLLLSMSLVCVTLSIMLIDDHLYAVTDTREASAPLIAQLPVLETQVDRVQEQIELAELYGATRMGSYEEKVNVFVIPQAFSVPRLLSLLEHVRSVLEQQAFIAAMSSVEIGEERAADDALVAIPITFDLTLREAGVQYVLDFLKLAGALTVADVLTEEQVLAFLRQTEAVNPAMVVPVSTFLGTDLWQYAQDPETYHQQVRRSIASDELEQAFAALVSNSLLHDARVLLSGAFGHVLKADDLWPMPLLTVERIVMTPAQDEGWYRLELELWAYKRG